VPGDEPLAHAPRDFHFLARAHQVDRLAVLLAGDVAGIVVALGRGRSTVDLADLSLGPGSARRASTSAEAARSSIRR
jgi:hypothetical protein